MPAKSKEQQRLFGMVHAYQKGELKNPSKEVKDIAKTISKKDAKDFAETKHKGLPNKVKKSVKETVTLSESQLRKIIAENLKKVINEWQEQEGNDIDSEIHQAITTFLGEIHRIITTEDAGRDAAKYYDKEIRDAQQAVIRLRDALINPKQRRLGISQGDLTFDDLS